MITITITITIAIGITIITIIIIIKYICVYSFMILSDSLYPFYPSIDLFISHYISLYIHILPSCIYVNKLFWQPQESDGSLLEVWLGIDVQACSNIRTDV